jgi:hypothetical protein
MNLGLYLYELGTAVVQRVIALETIAPRAGLHSVPSLHASLLSVACDTIPFRESRAQIDRGSEGIPTLRIVQISYSNKARSVEAVAHTTMHQSSLA